MFRSSNTSIDFYRDLSDNYDDERSIFTTLQKKFKFKTALDIACGTGLHAILLQKIGVDTVGTDNSKSMLDKARKNAAEAGIDVTWVQSDMRAVTKAIDRTFDVIFCIGNSLPHLITTKELLKALREWHTLLNADGRVIIQLLNYTKILKDNDNGIVPSCVGLDRDGRVIVGVEARNQASVAPDRTILSIKREMGSDTVVTMGDSSYRPQEISALLVD